MKLIHEFLFCVDNFIQNYPCILKLENISGIAIGNAGMIGLTKQFSDGRYWFPHEFGYEAIVLPVGNSNRLSGIVDLVAFQVHKPELYWQRNGYGSLLGWWNVEYCIHYDEQLTIHSNPLEWLKADCEGCCILDWSSNLGYWFSGINYFYCPKAITGIRLEHSFQRTNAMPEIRIGEFQDAE